MSDLLRDLNPSQQEAVQIIDGPLLVLAGAGSGKTRTLTTRLAYLIDEVGIPPYQTLTLTFTNKASMEMRERALRLLKQKPSSPPLLCTFHKFGLLFLRFYISYLERDFNFVLLDSDDKKKILKKYNETLPLGYMEHMISNLKNNLVPPEVFATQARDQHQIKLAKIYLDYQKTLQNQNLLDFDDLILLPFMILDKYHDLALEVSQKYSYIMVDEYQDTNLLQFKLLQKLCSKHQNICVVGDDDQSIYGWRGSDIRNILDFQEHFKGAKMIKLEENYRSTQEILEVANCLIKHNSNRLGKTLRSTKGKGEKVEVLHNSDESIEALFIAKKIGELQKQGVCLNDIAVLFRLNALSRSLEEGLNQYKIHYKLLGTIRFYERAEIKDILAYLRYLINSKDDFSLQRIINQPKRGIGKQTQDKIFTLAKEKNKSVYQAFIDKDYEGYLSDKNLKVLKEFFEILQDLRSLELESERLLSELLGRIDLTQAYNNSQENVDRRGNINEFMGLMRDYFIKNPNDLLEDFLNYIPLHSDLDNLSDEAVNCMSIHTAKGLEFDYVFVIGLENGFFPLDREESNLEEERRLGYVAFTRARKKLFVSYVDSRFYKGRRTQLEKSSFLKEAGLIQYPKQTKQQDRVIKKGVMVSHKIFGLGRVEEIIKNGQDTILVINFGGLRKPIMDTFVERV
ncbi:MULTISPECIES: ATP-dependent helicase [unclassified Helicobacter]|uniref:ATP-dependent helicase n=1 Tax=unclassified Helicobacter TaxID=2593540 RepID=UPI000CF0AE3A|nr:MULTISPECIES: UvrD-helicase domain-containing protein [unclassified Helicobacter]